MSTHQRLSDIAEIEFSDIVDVVEDFKDKLNTKKYPHKYRKRSIEE